MDKDATLTGILKPSGSSTLLGGEPLVGMIGGSRFVSLLTAGARPADGEAEDAPPPVHLAIHRALCGEARAVVVVVGGQGSGKTTSLEKLLVDWAKGEHLQGFSHVFYFRLRDVRSLESELSLKTLMLRRHVSPENMGLILQKPEETLFVLDDVDLYEPSLDVSHHILCSDPSQAVSVSCLISSLIHGSLLRGAAFVVATRLTEHLKFLSGTRVEILGLLKPQRDLFFHRFFSDSAAAEKALQHMERTLGFYDLCSSPRFCWTVCSIDKTRMDAGAELPKTLTQLFVDILAHLIQGLSLNEVCRRELVLALGRMASHCSAQHRPSITKQQLNSFGFQNFVGSIDAFLQVDGDVESETSVFSLASRLMQDFMLVVSFYLDKSSSEGLANMLEEHGGHAEYLHLFLSGLSESDQRGPLESLMGDFNSDRIMDFKSWFKTSSGETLKGFDKDRHHRCFHLLHQAQNKSWVREVVASTKWRFISYRDLSLQDCVALNYVISCLGKVEMLNLYGTRDLTEEQAEVLAPALSMSHKVLLSDSSLTVGAVRHLASALSRGCTEELDLSNSHLGDEKFKVLSVGLRNCKLLTLKLVVCKLTGKSCEDLACVLTSGSSLLQVLHIMFNQIGDQGFMTLCKALSSPQCQLQQLQLNGCDLTAASMEALSAALCAGKSALKKVDLTQNKICDNGVEALCKSLQHPLCKLQSLTLFDNELTGVCCPHLMETLMSEHCSLLDLDLSVNDLGQEGGLLLCKALSHPGCPLEKLGLKRCELTEPVFKELGSLLRSGGSRLKSLILGINAVGDGGARHLWHAVANQACLLEELDVEMTKLTDGSVGDLCAAVRASKTLKSLNLSNNSLTDAFVPTLVQVMQSSERMQEMNLKYNDFSEEVFNMLDECDKIRY